MGKVPLLTMFARAKLSLLESLVRETGVEPARPFGHKILSLARLPVPPLPRWCQLIDYTVVPALFVHTSVYSIWPVTPALIMCRTTVMAIYAQFVVAALKARRSAAPLFAKLRFHPSG
jgi:hypothetical protein